MYLPSILQQRPYILRRYRQLLALTVVERWTLKKRPSNVNCTFLYHTAPAAGTEAVCC